MGLGNVRHIEVSTLWIQDKVRDGTFHIEKVGGKVNIADALTKYPTGEAQRMHLEGTFMRIMGDRHVLAPEVGDNELEVLT